MRSVFVLLEGFGAAERHALSSMFWLSRSRSTVYWQWRVGSARPPSVLLVDAGSSLAIDAALVHLENHPELRSIWVHNIEGVPPRIPEDAAAVLSRPLDWQALLAVLDEMYAPGGEHTWAEGAHGEPEAGHTMPDVLESNERVLVVDPNREHWLLVRAWMASRGYCDLDETASLSQAHEWLTQHPYAAVVVSDLWHKPDIWRLVDTAKNHMAAPFVLSAKPTLALRAKAKLKGVQAVLTLPLDLRPLTAVLHSRRS
jgi:CheY-like chemotaxis protein